jgi:hypothetical protein
MQTAIDLKRMTLPQKLRLMEALWEELRVEEENIPTPEWQRKLLDERERLHSEGGAIFKDWETAKQMIAQRTR